MPDFQPFVMEQMMSEWENVVDVNLSESGVHPMTLGELLAITEREGLARFDVLQPNYSLMERREYEGALQDAALDAFEP